MAHQRQLYSVLAKVCEGWHGPSKYYHEAQIWQIPSDPTGIRMTCSDLLTYPKTWRNDMRQKTYSTDNSLLLKNYGWKSSFLLGPGPFCGANCYTSTHVST